MLGQNLAQYLKNISFNAYSAFLFLVLMFSFSSLLTMSIRSNLFTKHLLNGWCLSLQSRQNMKSQCWHLPWLISLSMLARDPHPGRGHHPRSSIWAIALFKENCSYFSNMFKGKPKFLISKSLRFFLQELSGQVIWLICILLILKVTISLIHSVQK